MVRLKYWGEDAGGGFEEFLQSRAVLPLFGVDEGAELLVVEEDVVLAHGDVVVVDEGVDLEVLLQASWVEACGTYGGEIVVADDGLRMEEPFAVEVDFHAGWEQVAEVGLRGEACDGTSVASSRHHQPHVDTGKGCIADGQEDGLRRGEIRGLDIEIAAALRNHLHHALHHGVPFVHRSRGDYLRNRLVV